MDIKPNKEALINKISSLLYDFTGDQLGSIYSALCEIKYAKEDRPWKILKPK